jgi:hypothetical protein
MTFDEDSAHYRIGDSAEVGAEWQALSPGDGLFKLGDTVYTTSMFHQLRCLDVLRKEFARPFPQNRGLSSQITRHCFNYLRQMILCRSDLHLRSSRPDVYICRDWEKVYSHLRLAQT